MAERNGDGPRAATDDPARQADGPGTAAAGPEDPALAEVRDRAQRAIADADNARKRAERTTAERVAAERQRVAAAWLPVLDSLDLALHHAGADPEAIVQGVAQVRDQATDVLARLGFGPVGAIGEPFDPTRHEAAEAVEEPSVPPGTVVRVIRPGYGGDTLLLRPAVVAVARAGRPEERSDGPDPDRESDGG
ncbi:nucleotide exchange factor GrpE [Dactylosporangium vinaceum]|uniref:Protein GrpE n=1 Tax=Dactylosporangium vinaceum TaxID=53362 RepID=A0ABV5MKU6_9ACTN|nr:nucleotide exchange factor GrpE [Dactylosporangium vinaceum]UAB93955.1 nucleotide exchange factor GrpE [Dactylosporangium vinaceum]